MKNLLKFTAIIEALAGVTLVIAPSWFASVLIGVSLEGGGALLVARIGGSALMSLAIACWLSRNSTAPAMVHAMLFYNTAVAGLLLYGVGVEKFSGPGLWPAVFLHAGLSAWCVLSLQKRAVKNG